eukprot:CAMPEP_0170607690 /NCGR_PEP_ID=MMETSP0224-20130122/21188_1 /TAXON_ID=285029 /ORGANISM="Togula jolla, Strain CCCM 725" /LENGTH=88 /DNA_ID=CAMNT_0010932871 /DNA_START=169 /DNA_END=435 /DNA_ORIENTATION=-
MARRLSVSAWARRRRRVPPYREGASRPRWEDVHHAGDLFDSGLAGVDVSLAVQDANAKGLCRLDAGQGNQQHEDSDQGPQHAVRGCLH